MASLRGGTKSWDPVRPDRNALLNITYRSSDCRHSCESLLTPTRFTQPGRGYLVTSASFCRHSDGTSPNASRSRRSDGPWRTLTSGSPNERLRLYIANFCGQGCLRTEY